MPCPPIVVDVMAPQLMKFLASGRPSSILSQDRIIILRCKIDGTAAQWPILPGLVDADGEPDFDMHG